ncbi:NHL repeat-containing protein, partial [Thermodesulfobacteriota bacterium]
MKRLCMIEKITGAIWTSCKYIILALFIVQMISVSLHAEGAAEVKKLFHIESTFELPFEQPSNFSVDSKGNIYLLEDLQERVLIFNKKGGLKNIFGNMTNKKIDIYKTYSISCDDYGQVHIFEPYQNAVVTFDSDGKLKNSTTLNFDDELEHKITDIAFMFNSFYLVDNANDYLYIFDTKGHITKRVGKRGELKAEFKSPFSLSFDVEGMIYVSDVLNSRVQKFASSGTYISQVGDFGFTDGGIFRPNGVAVDS